MDNTGQTTRPPIVRQDGVTDTERYLKRLCERTFLSLWSHAGVYRDQGRTATSQEGKEVCDLIVVFERHIIIFSDKDCEFARSGKPILDWSRWFRRPVQKSAEQVWGAERWIKSLFHKGVWAIEWGMEHKPYPSDLTDDQWATLQPLIPRTRPGGRPRKTDMRAVVNALFYVSRQGCTWRALPHDFPPWKTVYNYFQWFQWDGTWQRLVDALRERVREKAGRQKTPSACAIDSQSVKTAEGGREIGNDGGKKVHGRKRHILVDTLGLLIAVVVTAANVDDGRAAQDVFAQARGRDFPRLEVVFADNKYHNYALYDWLRLHRRPYRLEVVSRPPGERKFKPLKIRWVVERTFAWLGRYRRLSKDYEHLPESSQAMVQLGAIHHMLRRLKPKRKAWSQRFRFKGHRPKSAA